MGLGFGGFGDQGQGFRVVVAFRALGFGVQGVGGWWIRGWGVGG